MGPLYAYSLAPVLAVAVLLFFTAAFRGRGTRTLALYCLSVGVWSGSLLLVCLPSTAAIGERMVASGTFIAAAYIHLAFDVTEQKRTWLVGVAYLVATAITGMGAVQPGLLYGAMGLTRGPLFWPAMALSLSATAMPAWFLWRGYTTADDERRPMLQQLLIAGLLCGFGGMGNALLLSSGVALPFGMILVMGSLLILGHVIRNHEPPGERKLLERSLLYAALTAFLSAGFMFGVLSLMSSAAEPLVGPYRVGALFLLALAALAFEPLRQQLQDLVGRRWMRRHTRASDLVRALEATEEKAERAERLAEIGTLVSAVAHEVRNPLGVLAAHLKMLERAGTADDTVQSMREQIGRATRFVDDLLRYGRPPPLELRMVDLDATLDLALSTARQGLRIDAPDVEVDHAPARGSALIEADQAQMTQVFVILFDNALLALVDAPTKSIRMHIEPDDADGTMVSVLIEDSGPGIPDAIMPKLFQPFVTGRKREGPRPGTGLGLATARRIIERHGGTIEAGASALSGARFSIRLPRHQTVLGDDDVSS